MRPVHWQLGVELLIGSESRSKGSKIGLLAGWNRFSGLSHANSANQGRLFDVESGRPGRLARRIRRDFLDPGLGLPEQFLAAALQGFAPLIDRDRLLKRHLAFLEPFHDRFQLFDGPLEGKRFDVGIGGSGHEDSRVSVGDLTGNEAGHQIQPFISAST